LSSLINHPPQFKDAGNSALASKTGEHDKNVEESEEHNGIGCAGSLRNDVDVGCVLEC
jgi:hypothetical protein